MAKRVSNTARYFPHNSDASAGDTLTILQGRFKNDGYAFWFRLLERLTAADDHYLDMSNEAKFRTLAAKSFIDVETANEMIEILLETEAIDVELWTDYKIIWCRNLLVNLADVYRNRRRPMPQRPVVNDGIITCSLHVDDMYPTCNLHVNHKAKETKLNKTKLNKNSSSSSNDPQISLEKVLSLYSLNISETTEQTNGYIEAAYGTYGGYWITEAIGEAVRQNKRTWAYIEGILKNWQQYGFKNPESRYHIVKRG